MCSGVGICPGVGARGRGDIEQREHLGVGHWREALIEATGVELVARPGVADDLVGLPTNGRSPFACPGWHGDDDPTGAAGAQCSHRRQLRQRFLTAIIDHNHCPPMHVDRPPIAVVARASATERRQLSSERFVEHVLGQIDPRGRAVIQGHGPVLGYRADSEIGPPRRRKLGYREHVKWRREPLRDLERHRHPARRERDHDRRLPHQRLQLLGEPPASIASVKERHALVRRPLTTAATRRYRRARAATVARSARRRPTLTGAPPPRRHAR
jgi:hypothetical protein